MSFYLNKEILPDNYGSMSKEVREIILKYPVGRYYNFNGFKSEIVSFGMQNSTDESSGEILESTIVLLINIYGFFENIYHIDYLEDKFINRSYPVIGTAVIFPEQLKNWVDYRDN